jgi:hypothetical protein
VGAFPVWRPNLDGLDVDSANASAFLIPKSFKNNTITTKLHGLGALANGPTIGWAWFFFVSERNFFK